MSGLPPDLEALKRRLLRESGFEDIESRDGIIKRPRPDTFNAGEYLQMATARLVDYQCDRFTREILELHVTGMKSRAIARKLATYRKLVDCKVNRFKRWLSGAERGPGRPPVPGGRGDGCVTVFVRFGDDEAEALFSLTDSLGISRVDAVRLAVRAQAKSISDIGKGKR